MVLDIFWETDRHRHFSLAKNRGHPFLAKIIWNAPAFDYLGYLSPHFSGVTPVHGEKMCPFVGLLEATRMHVTRCFSWTQSPMVTNTFTSYDNLAAHWATKQPNASTSQHVTTFLSEVWQRTALHITITPETYMVECGWLNLLRHWTTSSGRSTHES